MGGPPEYPVATGAARSAVNAPRAATKRMPSSLSPGRHTASLKSRRPDLERGPRSPTRRHSHPTFLSDEGSPLMRTLFRKLPVALGATAIAACAGATAL